MKNDSRPRALSFKWKRNDFGSSMKNESGLRALGSKWKRNYSGS